MKRLLGALICILSLTSCADLLPPNPVTATNTCVVKDDSGRIWRWSASGNACRKAMYDCKRWHLDHPGFRNQGHCLIVEGAEMTQ